MIVIIDYGMGNLRSVHHKVMKAGIQAILSSRTEDVEAAEKLILPGVGAFGAGMEQLENRGSQAAPSLRRMHPHLGG